MRQAGRSPAAARAQQRQRQQRQPQQQRQPVGGSSLASLALQGPMSRCCHATMLVLQLARLHLPEHSAHPATACAPLWWRLQQQQDGGQPQLVGQPAAAPSPCARPRASCSFWSSNSTSRNSSSSVSCRTGEGRWLRAPRAQATGRLPAGGPARAAAAAETPRAPSSSKAARARGRGSSQLFTAGCWSASCSRQRPGSSSSSTQCHRARTSRTASALRTPPQRCPALRPGWQQQQQQQQRVVAAACAPRPRRRPQQIARVPSCTRPPR
jgi:hypothetical protein